MFCVEKKNPQIARAHRGKLGNKMFFVKRVWSNSSVDERQRVRNQDGLAGRWPKVRNQPEAPWRRNGKATDARHGSPSLGERLFYRTALLLCNPGGADCSASGEPGVSPPHSVLLKSQGSSRTQDVSPSIC